MRKIIFCLLFGFSLVSCEKRLKLTSYFEAKKELVIDVDKDDFIENISFLFVIDNSGSMSEFQGHLAENIKFLLTPIFSDYSYYNYNFAVTSTDHNLSINRKPLAFNKEAAYHCDVDISSFTRRSRLLGSYLHYKPEDFEKFDYSKLLCLISYNITTIHEGSASESFFRSLSYIISGSEPLFRSQFFGPDKILVLFFLSDAYEGVDFKAQSGHSSPKIANSFASEKLKMLEGVMGSVSNIRSYAVVLDQRYNDTCGSERGGLEVNNYPFHLYRFVEKTKGLRISICQPAWGKRLVEVFDDLKSSLRPRSFDLNEIPKLDSIEVFFNNKKIPRSFDKGWFFDHENTAIVISSGYSLSDFSSNESSGQVLIRYNPINIEIFAE